MTVAPPDPLHTPGHVAGVECRGAEVPGSARGDPRWSTRRAGGEALRRLPPSGAPVVAVVRGPGSSRPGRPVPPATPVLAPDGPGRRGVDPRGPPAEPGVGSAAAGLWRRP